MIAQLARRYNLQNTLYQCALLITIIAVFAILDAGQAQTIRAASMYIVGTATMLVCSHIIQTYKPIQGFQTINFYITSTICFLLIHPTQSSMWLVLAVICAGLLKYIIHPPIRLINPAVGGVTASYILSKLSAIIFENDALFVSWWGTDLHQSFTPYPLVNILMAGLLLLSCLYFVLSFRKTLLAGTFFMTSMMWVMYLELSQTFTSSQSLLFIQESFFSSFAFLTCVMVCEPKTSPQLPKHQFLIGVLGGTVAILLTRTFLTSLTLADPFTTTLIVMNLATYPLKKYGILK